MKITRYIFSDHYKKSSDRFRNIFGLYFDFKNNQFTNRSNPIEPHFVGSEIEFSNKEVLNEQTGLIKERVVLRLRNTEENRIFLESLYNDSSDPAAPEIIGPIKNVINNTLKNDKIIYEDLNASTFRVEELSSQTSDFYSTIYSKYNFFIPNYENKISSDVIPEEVLPNYYVVNLALSKDILNSISQDDYDGSAEMGQNSPYQDFFSKFDRFITLDKNILLNNTVNLIFGLVLVAYCEQYAKVYDNVSIDFIETAKKRFGSILANISNKEILDKINQYKDSYPFYLNIVWTTETVSPFLEFLKLAGISLNSLQEFINQKILLDLNSNSAQSELVNFIDLQINSSGVKLSENNNNLYAYDAGDWINNFINDILNDSVSHQDTVEHVTTVTTSPMMGGFNGTFNGDNAGFNNNLPALSPPVNIVDDSNSLSTLLNTIVAKPALDQLILRNYRTYKDILDGQLAKTEILFYKIEKLMDEGATLLQTFYIPNIPGVDIQNYVDTQVKYGKEYVYKIYAYTIIYGTRYFYKTRTDLAPAPVVAEINSGNTLAPAPASAVVIDPIATPSMPVGTNDSGTNTDFGSSTDQEISFNAVENSQSILNNLDGPVAKSVTNFGNIELPTPPVELEVIANQDQVNITYINPFIFDVYYFPVVKLVELDYTDRLRGVVIDFPPTPPIAEFFPIKDSGEKFKISLSPSSGEIRQFPEIISPDDRLFFDKIISTQKAEDGKIIFRYEGEISKYEMFRIENEPESYLSFSEDPTSRVKSFYNTENILIDEFVESNKDYYYTFRSYDFHNHFSNPSPVYKVRLYENDGVEFLDVSVFDFRVKEKIFSKTFKKFLKIDTSLEQKEYSYLDNRLGLLDESVYNKEFILRIKSKHTGKSIDLHFTFNKQNTI